jgi:hypothetical protein
MFDKAQFLESCAHETKVVKHLAARVPPGSLDYRPTPKQRSTLELLRYLTTCAIVPAKALVARDWDEAESIEKAAESLQPADFAAAMDRQLEGLRAVVAPLSDHDLATRDAAMPWGTPCRLGEGLVNCCVKTLVAYRMQLFLYAKAAGAHDLGPANCWAGVDPRPRAATTT